MSGPRHADGALLAISDLHVGHPENRRIVEDLRPGSPRDWLIVGGDISDRTSDVRWVLELLAGRFARVIWVPGNHELWCWPETTEKRGEERYLELVKLCRELGVRTPEDRYEIWTGSAGPVTVAPLFLLYDYSFGLRIAPTRDVALDRARRAGVELNDEYLLDPSPYPSRAAWCRARVLYTERRLQACAHVRPLVLVNHFPLVYASLRALRRPELGQWCGTELTADWHTRFGAVAVVHGHLHTPGTMWHDGVRFEEVSLGYPREREWWAPRASVREIFPAAPPGVPGRGS